jgi:N-acetylneuraminate synthase
VKGKTVSKERLLSTHSVLIIAEAGVNHNGDVSLAKHLVEVAAEAGADAIKFQTFITDRLITREAFKADYQMRTTDPSESQYQMLKRVELSLEQHREIVDYCEQCEILFTSTPFEEESADLLQKLGIPFFKIPSGDITNLPFLAHVAEKGLPMVVSTGMSTLGDVEEAVETVRRHGCQDLTLLHCTSNYPASIKTVNLRAMCTIQQAFGVPVGYSDHTLGYEVGVAAVALGARVIEKHFTLAKDLPGPDHAASLEPDELKAYVAMLRNAELALGDGVKRPFSSEYPVRDMARKSLVFRDACLKGTLIATDMIESKRPGTGLAPRHLQDIVGCVLLRDVEKDDPVSWTIIG